MVFVWPSLVLSSSSCTRVYLPSSAFWRSPGHRCVCVCVRYLSSFLSRIGFSIPTCTAHGLSSNFSNLRCRTCGDEGIIRKIALCSTRTPAEIQTTASRVFLPLLVDRRVSPLADVRLCDSFSDCCVLIPRSACSHAFRPLSVNTPQMPVETLGRAMVMDAESKLGAGPEEHAEIFYNKQIRKLADRPRST